MKRKLRLGMVGGGQGAFIGAVHRLSARMDDNTILITKNSLILDNKPIISISPDNTKTEIILEDIGKGKQIGKILSPQEGIWKFLYNNVIKEKEINFLNDKENGQTKIWYSNGKQKNNISYSITYENPFMINNFFFYWINFTRT